MRPVFVTFVLLAVMTGWMTPAVLAAQTVGSAIEQQLQNSGVDAETAGKIVKGVENQTGISFGGTLYDRVDFATFPNARVQAQKLKAPAVLILTPQLTQYVFRGKPETFQGSLRTYEFHLGTGIEKACTMIFPQIFEEIRGLTGPHGVRPEEVVIVPRLDEFKFKFGGMWTLKMMVTLRMSVGVFANGRQIFEKTYGVDGIKEGFHTIFPDASQEYEAISKAMITVLKQAAVDMASHPVLLAYEKPAPKATPAAASATPLRKIDMDAVVFLADTWEDYRKNVGRLSLAERVIAKRLLRLKDAWNNKNIDEQQDRINDLIQISKKLEPVSRRELLEEIKFHKKWTDREVIERNAFEDKIYNFAGDYTETVLDYAGVGITVSKLVVLATGCIASAGTACPALMATMGSFEAADIAAEGVGAASEEYLWKSGSAGKALFKGAKASVIEWGAGKLGDAASGALKKRAMKAAQERAVAAGTNFMAVGGAEDGARKVMDKVYKASMDRSLKEHTLSGIGALVKGQAKGILSDQENVSRQQKAAPKKLKPLPPAATPARMPSVL